MKILLLGCNGQVGWELHCSLAPLGELTALSRQGSDGLSGDLADPESLAPTVKALSPDVIVNAAAYTAVDQAESEPGLARLINAEAPAQLAREAKKAEAWLVHYSTDYVFDGSGSHPWTEDDSTIPVNQYGQTKLEGEQAIRQSGCRHLIFHTSWVYAARGKNFIRTMLKLASERDTLKVIDDRAHRRRTYSRRNRPCHPGRLLFQAARAGMTLKISSDKIVPVPSEELPTSAARPKNSRLDTTFLENTFGLRMPPWEDGVLRTVNEIISCCAW